MRELERRWPGGTDDAFEASPWASWPLSAQATPSGVVLNFTYSTASDLVQQVVDLAHERRLTVYDPQAGEVYARPTLGARARRRGVAVANHAVRYRVVRMVIIFGAVAGLLLLLGRCSS